MSERFKEIYRIPSARLQSWDYGWNGLYFITICTAGREHYFGEIIEGKIRLSEIGLLAERFWFEIPLHFPFILLDAFVVMPNHIHGILIIDKNDDGRYNTTTVSVETRHCLVSDQNDDSDSIVETRHRLVSTHNNNPDSNSETRQCLVSTGTTTNGGSPNNPTPGQQRFRNPGKNNISSIIGSYKSVVSKHAHQIITGFDWQAKFYDHIIRSDDSLNRIMEYIQNNPANWEEDQFFR